MTSTKITKRELRNYISPIWFDIIFKSDIIQVQNNALIFVLPEELNSVWQTYPGFNLAILKAVRNIDQEIMRVVFSSNKTLSHIQNHGSIVSIKGMVD